MLRALVSIAAATAFFAPPALAGCAEVAGNLLAKRNCAFAATIDPWVAVAGRASHHGGDGGALQGTVNEQGTLVLRGPCVPVAAGTELRFAFRLRSGGGEGYFFALQVFEFGDERCEEGAGVLAAHGMPPQAAWSDLETTETISDGTRAVRLELHGSGEPGAAVLLDELVVARP